MRGRIGWWSAVVALMLLLPAVAEAQTWQHPGAIAVSPDGRHVYAASVQMTIAMKRDPVTGSLEQIGEYPGADGGIAISPDGRSVYMGAPLVGPGGSGPDMLAYRRDPESGQLTRISTVPETPPHPVVALAVSPDGSRVYASRRFRHSIWVYDRAGDGSLSPRAEVTKVTANDYYGVDALTVDSQGRLYAAPGSGDLVVFEPTAAGLTSVEEVPGCCGSEALVFSAGEERLYSGPWGPIALGRDSTGTLKVLPTTRFTNGTEVTGASMAAAGDSLYIPEGAGLDHLRWSGSDLVRAGRHSEPAIQHARSVAVSPDGRHVYVAAGKNPPPDQVSVGVIAVYTRVPATGALVYTSLFKGPTPKVFVEIEQGAKFARDDDVHLWASGPSNYMGPHETYLASNEESFTNPKALTWDLSGSMPWRLRPGAPDGTTQTVYVRSSTGGAGSDSIIMDRSPPKVLRVRQRGPGKRIRRLRIRVRDRISGVNRIQLAANRRRPGRWRVYRARQSYRTKRRTVYVRVRDRAGNRSRWRKVPLRRARR